MVDTREYEIDFVALEEVVESDLCTVNGSTREGIYLDTLTLLNATQEEW
jgi:hypothetical protein